MEWKYCNLSVVDFGVVIFVVVEIFILFLVKTFFLLVFGFSTIFEVFVYC